MACRILVSHRGMESWHWKQQVLATGQPWNSQKTSSYYRRYTSPNLLSDLCSHHSPFSPSTPTRPAFILLAEYVPLISTHRAFAVPIVMDSFAVYLCVAASFWSDLVSSSQKKIFSVSLFMPWPVSPEPFPNLHCGVFLKGLMAAEMALCVSVCSLVQRPTPKSGHSLSKSKAPVRQHPAHSRGKKHLVDEHTHTHTHTHKSHCLPTRIAALSKQQKRKQRKPSIPRSWRVHVQHQLG